MANERNQFRTKRFRRNQSLEDLLKELNSLLHSAESQVEKHFETPNWPVILIVGSARSGTTLALQCLAQTGNFGYPTNLISRFYSVPYIGAKIQRLLVDPVYDFNNEFKDLRQSTDFRSALGKTRGLLAPNEFWYFWRRFIPNEEPRFLYPEEVPEVDRVGFAASLAALESALGKPLAMKGLILQYNLDILTSALDRKVIFIHVERHPFYNIQSLLRARDQQYGTIERWYSVKPKEYKWLKELSPVEQVAGQVYFTNQSISSQLEKMPYSRVVRLSYESFCQRPEGFFTQLTTQLNRDGIEVLEEYSGPKRFDSTNQITVSKERQSEIIEAWQRFSKSDIAPK